MKWITREKVKVDRVACPWLIKKLVDKDAEFVFVPGEKVMAEAKRLDAIPYDVKDVELGHHGRISCPISRTSLRSSRQLSLGCKPKLRRHRRNGGRVMRTERSWTGFTNVSFARVARLRARAIGGTASAF
jgi:hypothetical protein